MLVLKFSKQILLTLTDPKAWLTNNHHMIKLQRSKYKGQLFFITRAFKSN